jgi:hypothetical protein
MKPAASLLSILAMAMVLSGVRAEAAPRVAVAKYVKGEVRKVSPPEADAEGAGKPLNQSDLVESGSRIVAGQEGKAVIRLLPDNAFMDVRPKTSFKLRRVKSKGKRIRRVHLDVGEVVFGLRKKSEQVQCETVNTSATADKARFSCRAEDASALGPDRDATGGSIAVIIVQDGEVTVYNRPKNLSAVARTGQKAVSDLNGIKITDATDAELEQVGFRQNTLEVDFLNPQTDEFTTLEIEYETSF